jgi:serine/threonine protein kinase
MIGSTIAHYRIVEKLGEGGMGVVYKAEDLKLRRPVALKTLRAESQQLRARLLMEAEAAASLNHPNICTVYEIDDEHLFLAMEFLDGQTVAEKIRQQPLPLAEAIDIAVQSAQGLQAAHEKGVTHRDVKSSNIMITRSGQVKVMDFGLALTDELTRITQPGVVVGTAAYMSPEQAGGNPVDRRTDIWAMGIVLYEMISGRLPFRGETQAAVVHSILHDQPQPLTAVRSGLPIELDRIVRKALAKAPSERYQHIDEMLVDLKILRSSSGEQQRSQSAASPPPKSKYKRYLYAGAAALVVVLMVSIWQSKPRGLFLKSAPPTARATIAVLPLVNLSSAAGQEYFSDGMTDALITELGTIDTLRVISRTSVMRYKGSQERAAESRGSAPKAV